MDRIQTQASDLWDILFSEETANTYQKAFNLTGNILKESAQLLWLVVCSFFIFGAWFGDASMKTGKGVRNWVEKKDVSVPSPEAAQEIAAQKSKSLLDTGRESIAAALSKAREELGLDPNAPLAVHREDSPVAKLVAPVADSESSSSAISLVESPVTPSESDFDKEPSVNVPDNHPAAGAEEMKPKTSEGQDIGSPEADSRGTGAPRGNVALEKPDYNAGGMQAGGPQGDRYAKNQGRNYDDDYDADDVSEEEFVEDDSFGAHPDD
ncbi:MAG: hypothetical protein DCF25_16735 [Leptolyngbya foveolarum]|uniref:Uncharacterized protein n=1 Tax=Leptolyngbya foveolarum TaxID=47253 RepID=A0A2W4U1A1_9CYAN|nr:MAG: hypothetical protein DCF25_16735 [Leptolyngbya foveolarum]